MNALIDHRLRRSWTSEAADAARLPARAAKWLEQRIGQAAPSAAPPADLPVEIPSPKLDESAVNALSAAVGAENVLVDDAARLARATGLSYLDLLRRRSSSVDFPVPDAVVLPAGPDEVQAVLDICVRHDVGVVPFGGGTSVVGGVAALRGEKASVIALDLVRLDALVSVDAESRLAVLQAGVRGPEAERLLGEHGLTLGHIPQSFERATIGGFAATRSAGQASSGYGRFEDMVAGVRLATPRGEWKLGVAPASAAGPDLRQLAVGSEGTLGVITEVSLRVRPAPPVKRYEGYALPSWEAGREAVRDLAQNHALADITRLSDGDETEVSLSLNAGLKTTALRRYLAARGVRRPCFLIVGWEGTAHDVALRRRETTRRLKASGAVRVGKALGESWRHGRFAGPRQRDALLDQGVCVETLETAAYWSTVDELRDDVRAALTASLGPSIVMCHISHAYETGASLYFTVLTARDETDPVGQWQRAKAAACEAITGLGTISHHHAVGVDHAPYLKAEIGSLGVEVLRAAKSAVDPTGILNPGKLV
ncbi:Alkyldihydroxyacetonephosphate synthase (EC [Amycolatopsis camponoti]|uniref:Alkyldihydroxyacetonephosphate synthase (EC) n=1 Tax=Amycolatopsis camponoti TaxID=2606593 RepID=A0A6I8LDY9_9PSEU|nr:FAD-binding oxidoreductase [Amycolatopsis camponoti]VVJ15213.1 Alkyldihydroxyacetonephosphate synthase (EC [Amycolatopsis camponoti]